jgi:hypothetical protein
MSRPSVQNTLGGDMRQVTHLDLGAPLNDVIPGCAFPQGGIEYGDYRVLVQDPVTRAIIFDTPLDPLRVGRVPNDQVFAISPDGGGLRQLTDVRGSTTDPDGTLRVEMPGPFAYPAPIR